jgi:hypothetical protein
VVVFGRFYKEGDGLHDVHMNRGQADGGMSIIRTTTGTTTTIFGRSARCLLNRAATDGRPISPCSRSSRPPRTVWAIRPASDAGTGSADGCLSKNQTRIYRCNPPRIGGAVWPTI